MSESYTTSDLATMAVITKGIGMDKEREGFEKWHLDFEFGGDSEYSTVFKRAKTIGSPYLNHATECAWQAWQARAKLSQGADSSDKCEWNGPGYDGDIWVSSCGASYVFIDGGPKENDHRFCHSCGKVMTILEPPK